MRWISAASGMSNDDDEQLLSNAGLHEGERIGRFVVLQDQEANKEVTYQLVGVDEADIKGGKISFTSPTARAMTRSGSRTRRRATS